LVVPYRTSPDGTKAATGTAASPLKVCKVTKPVPSMLNREDYPPPGAATSAGGSTCLFSVRPTVVVTAGVATASTVIDSTRVARRTRNCADNTPWAENYAGR